MDGWMDDFHTSFDATKRERERGREKWRLGRNVGPGWLCVCKGWFLTLVLLE